jgi:hypothetical protein
MYSWSTRRQFIYMFGLILFVVSIISIIVYIKWPPPTCFDQKQNQAEEGIDCGGPCSLACPRRMVDLRLLWVRLITVEKGKYDVVGQVVNGNPTAGLLRFTYTVRLYDKDNVLLTNRSGESFANPNEQFYIFEGAINTRERVATRAVIDIDHNYVWRHQSRQVVPIATDQQQLSTTDSGTKLEAQVTNNSLIDLTDIPLYALLSDADKNVIGASVTMINKLPKGASAKVVFTWPTVYDPAPTYIDIFPRLNYSALR